MKKVLFISLPLVMGGTEKALVEMLRAIPQDEYEIHLGLLGDYEYSLQQIPAGIHYHDLRYYPFSNKTFLISLIKSFKWIDAIGFIISVIKSKVAGSYYSCYKYRYKDIPMIECRFDLAVAYKGYSNDCVYFLFEKVQARSKCVWIHEDVLKQPNHGSIKMIEKFHNQLSRVFLVSDDAKRHFSIAFPNLVDKTETFYNILPVESILQKAEFGCTFDDGFNGKRILTVGRIVPAKGLKLAIDALRILISEEWRVRWYIIGGTLGCGFHKQCLDYALQEGVADSLVFLGEKDNPYRFMKDCDCYVQPSFYECCCIAVNEALCFGSPIVVTDFCSSQEQLSGRSNGYITRASADSLAAGIARALNDKKIITCPVQRPSDLEKLLCLT